jgi:hypothetical protein
MSELAFAAERRNGLSTSAQRRFLSQVKGFEKGLSQGTFINEAHFLFWRPPFKNKRNEIDGGWMCREHALVAASFGALLGFSSSLMWGKVALIGYVEGPPEERLGHIVDIHSWAGFENAGVCDLSLNLNEIYGRRWKAWPIKVLTMQDHPRVNVRVYPYEASKQWEGAITEAGKGSGFHIIYLGDRMEPLSARYIQEALDHINSPLSDELRNLNDSEIYSKAVRHLWGVYHRRRKCMSISGISQSDAWKELSRMEPGASDWLVREANLPIA